MEVTFGDICLILSPPPPSLPPSPPKPKFITVA